MALMSGAWTLCTLISDLLFSCSRCKAASFFEDRTEDVDDDDGDDDGDCCCCSCASPGNTTVAARLEGETDDAYYRRLDSAARERLRQQQRSTSQDDEDMADLPETVRRVNFDDVCMFCHTFPHFCTDALSLHQTLSQSQRQMQRHWTTKRTGRATTCMMSFQRPFVKDQAIRRQKDCPRSAPGQRRRKGRRLAVAVRSRGGRRPRLRGRDGSSLETVEVLFHPIRSGRVDQR